MAEHDEVADGWYKSSASGAGECVEARIVGEYVHLRDSKNRPGSVLTFSHQEWRAFLAGVRLGEFEVPDE
jgi:hypothetical protein